MLPSTSIRVLRVRAPRLLERRQKPSDRRSQGFARGAFVDRLTAFARRLRRDREMSISQRAHILRQKALCQTAVTQGAVMKSRPTSRRCIDLPGSTYSTWVYTTLSQHANTSLQMKRLQLLDTGLTVSTSCARFMYTLGYPTDVVQRLLVASLIYLL